MKSRNTIGQCAPKASNYYFFNADQRARLPQFNKKRRRNRISSNSFPFSNVIYVPFLLHSPEKFCFLHFQFRLNTPASFHTERPRILAVYRANIPPDAMKELGLSSPSGVHRRGDVLLRLHRLRHNSHYRRGGDESEEEHPPRHSDVVDHHPRRLCQQQHGADTDWWVDNLLLNDCVSINDRLAIVYQSKRRKLFKQFKQLWKTQFTFVIIFVLFEFIEQTARVRKFCYGLRKRDSRGIGFAKDDDLRQKFAQGLQSVFLGVYSRDFLRVQFLTTRSTRTRRWWRCSAKSGPSSASTSLRSAPWRACRSPCSAACFRCLG